MYILTIRMTVYSLQYYLTWKVLQCVHNLYYNLCIYLELEFDLNWCQNVVLKLNIAVFPPLGYASIA